LNNAPPPPESFNPLSANNRLFFVKNK
jgi:hypothetical protein